MILLFVNHSTEQPEQQAEELSNARPDVVYGHVVPNQEPEYEVRPNDYEIIHDTLAYSELISNDNDNHTASPSGDMYAQVQKH